LVLSNISKIKWVWDQLLSNKQGFIRLEVLHWQNRALLGHSGIQPSMLELECNKNTRRKFNPPNRAFNYVFLVHHTNLKPIGIFQELNSLKHGSQTQSVSRAAWNWNQDLAGCIKNLAFFWVNIDCFWENRPICRVLLLKSSFFLMFVGRIGPSRVTRVRDRRSKDKWICCLQVPQVGPWVPN